MADTASSSFQHDPDKPWIFRTYAGHSTAEESNKLYRGNLAKGQTGLSIAFDLPTQTAYDADHVLSRGEVGKVGVPIGHLGDMRTLFQDIPVAEMNTSMTINAPAAWLLSLYVALADDQGASRKALRGTTQNDIIKEYLSRGTYVFPPKPSMRLIDAGPEKNQSRMQRARASRTFAPRRRLAWATLAAIAAQLFGSFLGHIPIALEDIRSAHFDLANIPLGQCVPRGAVSDFQLNPRKRKSDCPRTARALIGIRGAHIRFCHAVALKDAMTAALFKQLMSFRQKRRAARDKKPHVPGQSPVEAWIIKQPSVKGRHAHHRGSLWQ